MATYTLEEDNSAPLTIDADVGVPVTVQLRGRATAGYVWDAHADNSSLRVTRQDGRTSNPASTIKPGTENPVLFELSPMRAGDVSVTFSLRRPGEKHSVKTHTVVVKAK